MVLLHTARVESNGIKRLFMMYVEGRRQPKTVFKNEYGFDVGTLEQTVGEMAMVKLKYMATNIITSCPKNPVAFYLYSAIQIHNH